MRRHYKHKTLVLGGIAILIVVGVAVAIDITDRSDRPAISANDNLDLQDPDPDARVWQDDGSLAAPDSAGSGEPGSDETDPQ